MADWTEVLRIVAEAAVSGGLVVTLVTLKAARKKAENEAEGLAADNEQKSMDLAKNYVDEFRANIVEPLQKEVKGLRRDVKNLKNAINKINDCPHSAECPVYGELQKQQQGEQDAPA